MSVCKYRAEEDEEGEAENHAREEGTKATWHAAYLIYSHIRNINFGGKLLLQIHRIVKGCARLAVTFVRVFDALRRGYVIS